MRDIFIEHDDSPGAIALIGEVLGAAGVIIEGLLIVARHGRGIIHFAVEDAVTAKRVLENSGIRIKEVCYSCPTFTLQRVICSAGKASRRARVSAALG